MAQRPPREPAPSLADRIAASVASAAARATDPQRGLDELVEEIAAIPEVVARLHAEHVPDNADRHCEVCTIGQRGRYLWPCRLRALADLAHELLLTRPPFRARRAS